MTPIEHEIARIKALIAELQGGGGGLLSEAIAGDISAFQSQLQQTLDAIAAARVRLAELEAEKAVAPPANIPFIDAAIATVQDSIQRNTIAAESLRARIQQLQATLVSRQAQIAALQAQLAVLEAQQAALELLSAAEQVAAIRALAEGQPIENPETPVSGRRVQLQTVGAFRVQAEVDLAQFGIGQPAGMDADDDHVLVLDSDLKVIAGFDRNTFERVA